MKKLTPKEFEKMIEKMDQIQEEKPVFFTSRKVFEKAEEVKNAPWWRKLYWSIRYFSYYHGGYND